MSRYYFEYGKRKRKSGGFQELSLQKAPSDGAFLSLHTKLFHSRKLRSYARGLLRGIPLYSYFDKFCIILL